MRDEKNLTVTINLFQLLHGRKNLHRNRLYQYTLERNICRSSHQRFSMKKGVLKNFAKFTGKHLCQSLFYNEVAGLAATLLEKRFWHRCFPVNFLKFLRTPFLTEHLWWLLLYLCNCYVKSLWVVSFQTMKQNLEVHFGLCESSFLIIEKRRPYKDHN